MPVKAAAKPPFKIPAQPAAAADMWYSLMQERFALQHQIKAIEEKEALLKAHLKTVLPKNDSTGIAGKLVSVALVPKTRVEVKDWSDVYKFIAANYKKNPGVFGIMQKRMSDEAVKELAASGKKVPGTELVNYMSLSYSAKK